MLDQALDPRHPHGVTLPVLDSLTASVPAHPAGPAACRMEAPVPLPPRTSLAMSVLRLHPPRRQERARGIAARGRATLWRWLDQALAQVLVCQDGNGRKLHPFRYWLPGQEAKWEAEGLALLEDLGGLQTIPGIWPVPTRAKQADGHEKHQKAQK